MKRILTALVLCSTLASAQISGYTFTQYSPGYTPIVGTTVFSGTTDDSLSATIPLGFSFFFGTSSFTDIKVCSNGWITFDTAATTGTNYSSISGTVANIVAPFSRDLQGNTAGKVETLLSGAPGSQIFTVQWTNYRKYFATVDVADNFNFQINLYEGSNFVEFVYGTMTTTIATVNSCQVGLKGTVAASDFKCRTITNPTHTWATSIPGASNAALCNFLSTNMPVSGDAFLFVPGFKLTFSAPSGAGSIQADLTNGQPFGGYIFAVTFAPGSFPNGWLGGLDIPLGDLLGLLNAGFPFVGPLGPAGEFAIGPFTGLPTGFQIWGSAISTTTILGSVTAIASASTFIIP